MMRTLQINTTNPYSIVIDAKLDIDYLLHFCQGLACRTVIISDSNVATLYGNKLLERFIQRGIKADLLQFPAGEKNKNRRAKEKLEDQLLALGCSRDTCLIALGGGVTTDLVGFVASTYCRGVPVIYIPTTLLSMIDASIGGKTGVNTVFGKNLIGSFYQPKAVFIDMSYLSTLSKREIKNGLSEMIKHGLIADKGYFKFLQEHQEAILALKEKSLKEAIFKSCIIKAKIVEQDEKDNHIRKLLNFGHTIGHGLETITRYQLNHGEAVALGIVAESYLSYKLGLLSQSALDEIMKTLKSFGTLTVKKLSFAFSDFEKALLLDKKNNNNKIHIVMLEQIGKAYKTHKNYTKAVGKTQIEESLNFLLSELS